LLDAILQQKARINYLIAQKSALRKLKISSAHSFTGADPLSINGERYKAILLSRSTTAEQAHHIHQAWVAAYADALEAVVLVDAERLLIEKSEFLSKAYAEESWQLQHSSVAHEKISIKQASESGRLWQVVAGPTTSPQNAPTAQDIAKSIAEKLFTQQAAKVLGRALPHLALLYPTDLADGEIGPSTFATAAAELGVASNVDLGFIASRRGTVDVTHRMTFEETAEELATAWVTADGVSVGTKVRVRSFIYNPGTHRYEFTRDGDTKPSLVWTPTVTPGNSSTNLPSDTRDVDHYFGAPLTPVSEALGDYPTYDAEDEGDFILVFPEESGLDPVYVMLKSPRYLPGIVSGMGGATDPNWELSASKGLGSPIPTAVADTLKDRSYAEFRSLKKAIWREISKLPEATKYMTEENIQLIRKGNSPIAPYAEQNGKNVWYEIHHISPIWKEGAVYDLDNLVINTPLNHKKIHNELRSD
jgi:hypothetical protein